jgi:mono/diheme cytochrome c family protein
MHHTFIVVAALLGAAVAPFAIRARAAPPLELKSVTVELPDSDRAFPPGPGSDAVTNNCLACHSAGMILDQPALSKAAWTAEVNKMITAYKAPVAPEDIGAIVDYLARLRSPK